jgi:hypothetical protein
MTINSDRHHEINFISKLPRSFSVWNHTSGLPMQFSKPPNDFNRSHISFNIDFMFALREVDLGLRPKAVEV